MDSYQRLVAYLYEYENGQKGRNVGFGRIEIQNGILKLTLHMKSLQGRLQGGKVFLFYREQEKLSGIEVGEMVIQGNYGDFRLVTNRDNLMGSGIAFSRICGLSVGEGTHYAASEWDGGQLDVAHFCPHKMVLEAAECQSEIVEVDEGKPEETKAAEAEVSREETKAAETEVSREETKAAETEVRREGKRAAEAEVSREETKIAEAEVRREEPADALFTHCQVHPFFESEETEYCVKMEPKDIGYLPMETWGMAGNSFLLHGYYQFHHLIFLKKKGKEGRKVYYMGVPGFYRNQDKSMAQLFGFLQFACCQGDAPVDGEFGYWLQQVIL